jgi:hypothetical protein
MRDMHKMLAGKLEVNIRFRESRLRQQKKKQKNIKIEKWGGRSGVDYYGQNGDRRRALLNTTMKLWATQKRGISRSAELLVKDFPPST